MRLTPVARRVHEVGRRRGDASELKRTPRIELRFRDADDRDAIVQHRLFSNANTYDRDAARTVVRSYVNTWRKFGVETQDPYVERMEHAYPFLPDLIELVFERITESGGFQGTRSALGLLGAMLDAMNGGNALMSAAHCKVTDRACTDRLQDLDPTGTLITCAASNQRDLARPGGLQVRVPTAAQWVKENRFRDRINMARSSTLGPDGRRFGEDCVTPRCSGTNGHGDNMKSRVRIDDDLMADLRSRARVERMSVPRMLNRVIRAGLAASSSPREKRERYEEVTVRMGRPRADINKALGLAAALEDEETIRKISSCQ